MTTIAQVKQMVQPLLQRNSDLALVGRLVVIKPVHHILRGVSISRSLDPNLFVPKWAVIVLFKPRERFMFNWGEGNYRVRPERQVWNINDPQASISMCQEIERVALPLLRPIQGIDDFVGFTTKENFDWMALDYYRDWKLFVDVARGDLQAARDACAFFATNDANDSPDTRERYDSITKTLCPLLAANDRSGLAGFLRDCEAYSVKKMKLEKFWEPTPFPLELQQV